MLPEMERNEEGRWEVRKIKAVVKLRLSSSINGQTKDFTKDVKRTVLPMLGTYWPLDPKGHLASHVETLSWPRDLWPVITLSELVVTSDEAFQRASSTLEENGWLS